MNSTRIISASEQETLAYGRTLGRLFDQPALVFLQGDLGAGKSVLARGVARGLGVPEDIPITSPTFTLMNHYQGRLNLYHFDLYRLGDPDELTEIGFEDYAYGDGIALVEWPEKIGDENHDGLWITLARLDDQSRSIDIVARGEKAQMLLERIARAAGFI